MVINLLGAPSAGKSVMAAGLFAKMKIMGLDVDYVTEYAKDLVWEERADTFRDELYIFAKQNHRIFRVNGKVDFIITDAPLLLKLHYMPKHLDFSDTVKLVYNQYHNVNFLLTRKDWSFEKNGRNQTEAEARAVEDNIVSQIQKHNLPINKLSANTNFEEDMNYILEKVKEYIQANELTTKLEQ